MKVALVHDFLIQDGGAERVLLAFHELFPDAPIYTLFYDPERAHPDFRGLDVRPSFLNRFPFAPDHYEWYLPLMAQAVESLEIEDVDLILSSSSSFAKGVIAPPNALHVCYCHTPPRFLWHERLGYVRDLQIPGFVKSFLPGHLHRLRQWDRIAAARPDVFLTNSYTSQTRIQRYYQREATVIYPPVDVETISFSSDPGSYWLAGGRFVPYKRFDLVVKAFAKLNLPLKIFGEGPEFGRLKKLAGPRTEFLGHVSEQAKLELYQHAVGFLYPQMEDFGITAIEAMAAGKPVIAYGQGGVTETLVPGITGEYFDVQCWEDIANAVIRFNPAHYIPARIREHALTFSKQRFLDKMDLFVQAALQKESGFSVARERKPSPEFVASLV